MRLRSRNTIAAALVLTALVLPALVPAAIPGTGAPTAASAAESTPTAVVAAANPSAMYIAVSARTVSFREDLTVNGTLVAPSGGRIPGKTVVLESSFDGSTWARAGTRTSSTGVYSFTVRPERRVYYRVRFAGDQWTAPATSAAQLISVRAYLSTPKGAVRVYQGKVLTLAGMLNPRHKAGYSSVSLQAFQYVRGSWKLINRAAAVNVDENSYTAYRTNVTLPYAGRWRIRAVHGDPDHLLSTSGYAYVTVLEDPVKRFAGSGGQASGPFRLSRGVVVFRYSYAGQNDNFIVSLVDARTGADVALLANEIGSVSGSRVAAVPLTGTYRLSIIAGGSWNISLEQPRISSPRALGRGLSQTGHGPSATRFFYLPAGGRTFRYSYSGPPIQNFIVWLYSADGTFVHLLANGLGQSGSGNGFVGAPRSGAYVMDVYTFGDWSVSLR